MNVVTPSSSLRGNVDVNVNINQLQITGNLSYTPLPRALRNPEDFKGDFFIILIHYNAMFSKPQLKPHDLLFFSILICPNKFYIFIATFSSPRRLNCFMQEALHYVQGDRA